MIINVYNMKDIKATSKQTDLCELQLFCNCCCYWPKSFLGTLETQLVLGDGQMFKWNIHVLLKRLLSFNPLCKKANKLKPKRLQENA